MESYPQYIRDTRRAWATMPKPELLSEIVDRSQASCLIDAHSGDPDSAGQNHIDLADGQVVYLTDRTCLKLVGRDRVRHWR